MNNFMLIKKITIDQIKRISYRLAAETMNWNEPIPEFETRFPKVLESCVATPFQKFSNLDLYNSLVSKATVLFYLMIKNHPFQNGNKRLAMTTLLVFLYLNNKWLRVDRTVLYNFAVWVAGSSSDFKDEVIQAIEKFIKKYMVNF